MTEFPFWGELSL